MEYLGLVDTPELQSAQFSLAWSWISYKWYYTYILLYSMDYCVSGFFWSTQCLWDSTRLSHMSEVCFFFLISLIHYMNAQHTNNITIYLSIPLLVDIWVALRFCVIWIQLQWTFLFMSFGEHNYSLQYVYSTGISRSGSFGPTGCKETVFQRISFGFLNPLCCKFVSFAIHTYSHIYYVLPFTLVGFNLLSFH